MLFRLVEGELEAEANISKQSLAHCCNEELFTLMVQLPYSEKCSMLEIFMNFRYRYMINLSHTPTSCI